jgi:hypothetical protein
MTRQLVIERTSSVWNKYLWLKTVHGVNLTVHCQASLIGPYQHVHNVARRQELRLPEAPAYYLCGVTEPYKWALNSHVMMVPDDTGEWLVAETPTMRVAMWGVRPVPIGEEWLEDLYNGHRDYVTCRNLMGAWRLHKEFGLPNNPQKATKLRKRQAQTVTRTSPKVARPKRTKA